MHIDQCNITGGLRITIRSGDRRRFMQCLDITEICRKVFQESFFCRAGITKNSRDIQLPE
ncbi:Uncharacterised protein [Mycobacterium tuberculosis]|nr:Uncharacterised protein [Mycobacterium tuberculosis]